MEHLFQVRMTASTNRSNLKLLLQLGQLLRTLTRVCKPRLPKVDEAHLPINRQEDVGWSEVSVDNSLVVNANEGLPQERSDGRGIQLEEVGDIGYETDFCAAVRTLKEGSSRPPSSQTAIVWVPSGKYASNFPPKGTTPSVPASMCPHCDSTSSSASHPSLGNLTAIETEGSEAVKTRPEQPIKGPSRRVKERDSEVVMSVVEEWGGESGRVSCGVVLPRGRHRRVRSRLCPSMSNESSINANCEHKSV